MSSVKRSLTSSVLILIFQWHKVASDLDVERKAITDFVRSDLDLS